MDEQRVQAYVALIKQLLNRPSEAVEILQANRELLDRGFLEVAWLYADQVALQFLMEILQMVAESGSNREQVYPFFATHQQRLDLGLLQALPFGFNWLIDEKRSDEQQFIAATFGEFATLIAQFPLGQRWLNLELAILAYIQALRVFTHADFPKRWASVQNDLASAYYHRIRGNRAENLELSIQAYEQALQVRTRNDLPVQWAATQNNLANTYCDRIHGDRAENLELAIQAFNQALQVRTRQDFPTQWATTQNNLARAYSFRIRGDRAENLELAIQSYEQALQVRTRSDLPVQWADTQNNLANTYCERIRGDRAENLELAIQAFNQALQVRTHTDFPVEWAITRHNLAGAYFYRICGDRGENLEIAIQACEKALQVYTRTDSPNEWATMQCTLANVYCERIRGTQAENLELAIQAYEKALQVYTRTDSPNEWATMQCNLAVIYVERIRGTRAENLELAIQACEKALQVYTKADFSIEWAGTQHGLANVYFNRIRGDRAENLELAIQAYNQALQFRTRTDFPDKWAGTQHNLANALRHRIRGDRAENLELAIQALNQVLQIYTRADFPSEWAMTQNDLANTYSKRIRGNRAENLELAVQACEQALQVYTQVALPNGWARTQHTLAITYWGRIRGDQAENLELAIQACEQALQVHTRTDFPVDWAATQNNLANIYSNRICGDRAENLELAIQACEQALQVYTRTDFPVQWAGTHHNLAIAYSDRIRGDCAENLEWAIASCHKALEIHHPKAFPLDCLKTSYTLGNLHFREGNWTAAVDAYTLALQGLDQARQWAATDDRRQELQDEAASVYTNLIQSYVQLECYGKAIETVERSRSQRLVHLMASQDYYAQAGISPELQTLLSDYDSLQTQINQLQRQQATLAQTRGRAALSALSEEIHTLETQKQTLRQQISRLDPVSAGIIQVSPIDLATLQTLIPRPECALLSFYITSTDTHIFILKQTHITCHTCPNQGNALRDWLFETWLKPYAEINFADTDDERIQRRQAWITQMPDILHDLVDRLNLPELIETHLQDIDDLILVPHLLLHQIPFAALPLESGYLSDRFTLRQVPSTQILKFCHDRPPLQPTAYGTVEDATDDLPCSSFEGDQIAHLHNIPTTQRLRGSQQATVSNYLKLLPQVQTLLSSHHAHSRLDNPLESSLQLGDGSITLGNLISPAIRLPNLADIFLSCCETGLSHNLGRSDEPLSLASGFLYAGARNVVSTLWAVDDLATAIFSIRYHHHRQNQNRVMALKHAQNDLRSLTGTDLKQHYAGSIDASLEERYEQVYAQVKTSNAARDACERTSKNYPELEAAYKFWRTLQKRIDQAQQQLKQLCRAERPFEHPVYWSGFVCQGLE